MRGYDAIRRGATAGTDVVDDYLPTGSWNATGRGVPEEYDSPER
jgi:hypothetical protein